MSRNKRYNEEEVLEKAMQVFWKNGYEATSVRLLEKEMGINQFSIYASFQNKKNLFIHAIQNYRAHVKKTRFQTLLQENAGFTELENFLYKAVSLNTAGIGSKGCLIVNTAGEIGSNDPEIAMEVNRYYDFILEMLRNIFRNAILKHEIPADTNIEQQANFFLGIMQSLSIASKTMNCVQLDDFVKVALKQIK